jgi:hypothetical protein
MSERRTDPADWAVPAILVGVGLGLLLILGLVLTLTDVGRTEPEGLAGELEVYTQCLAGHGANVPIVEANRDGGFSVTVPGSLVDEGFDTTAWMQAYGECGDVAPDLFGGLLGALGGGILGGFPGGMSADTSGDFIGRLLDGI